MTPDQFDTHNRDVIASMGDDQEMTEVTRQWFAKASQVEYSYHFKWLGVPIIQFPQDVMAIQEVIWEVKPDLIIETGVARGGSLILYASLLKMIGEGRVIGVDIDIRDHNRRAIESHPLASSIDLIQGSSTDPSVVEQVYAMASSARRALVILDSNHTHQHVLDELNCYEGLVQKDSYLITLDTVIEDMPESFSNDRPWGPGDNPKTAVHEFLKTNPRFEIDRSIQDKLQITVGPDGYLRCKESVASRKAA